MSSHVSVEEQPLVFFTTSIVPTELLTFNGSVSLRPTRLVDVLKGGTNGGCHVRPPPGCHPDLLHSVFVDAHFP